MCTYSIPTHIVSKYVGRQVGTLLDTHVTDVAINESLYSTTVENSISYDRNRKLEVKFMKHRESLGDEFTVVTDEKAIKSGLNQV